MKKIFFEILLTVAACFPVTALCQQRDSVFLYNGQILIGDIKGIELGVLTINDKDLKLQNIKLYKIKVLNTAQEFRIETNDKHIYFGTLHQVNASGHTDIITVSGERIALQITDINTMVFLGKDFLRRLDGNIGAGFSYSKSSGVGQFNLNSSVTFVTKKFENNFQLNTLGSLDSGNLSRDNENMQLVSYYSLNAEWILTGYLSYQRNLELSLARRFQEMLGGGNKIVAHKHFQIFVISGIAFNQEKSTDGNKSPLLVEIPFIVRLNFYKFQHPNIQIASTQSAFFSLSEKGRIRYNGNTSFSWELIKDFSFTMNFYNNFDNKPPLGSISKFDYGMVMGLSYKF